MGLMFAERSLTTAESARRLLSLSWRGRGRERERENGVLSLISGARPGARGERNVEPRHKSAAMPPGMSADPSAFKVAIIAGG